MVTAPTPVNSIEIPYNFQQLCAGWYHGMDMLYAINSTGGLTLGSLRPSGCDTDEKWYLSIWRELSCDVGYARRGASKLPTKEGQREFRKLEKFEKWVEEIVAKLEAEYGLADWEQE